MTRAKKSRSMKRIHSVKTGSISKLKRAAGNDRQVGKRVKGRRVLSSYEKFLLENPEASDALKAEQKQLERAAIERKAEKDAINIKEDTKAPVERQERGRDLLEQLDSKISRDIY